MLRSFLTTAFLLVLAASPAEAVGFQTRHVDDADGRTIEVAIWYPSHATPHVQPYGPFPQNVAVDGALDGDHLPLVIISHGSGGYALNHYATAIALAEAGFIVAAPTHPGDNYQDGSQSFDAANFDNRPRQVSRVLDDLLQTWSQHAAIDPARIGILGHSAGGATALLLIGGKLDWNQVRAFCQDNPNDWACAAARRQGAASPAPAGLISHPDPRIKAAVLAAPALAADFPAEGLAGVRVPVQLWLPSEDRIVTNDAVVATRLPVPPQIHPVPGAGHFAFLTPCSTMLAGIAPAVCSDPPGFDRAAFQTGFHQSIIAFFKENLR